MVDTGSLDSSDEGRPEESVENEGSDDFKLVAEVAEMFDVHIRSVYRGVQKGHVRSKGKWPMRVSVEDYRKYRAEYGKYGPQDDDYDRDPNETERKVLRLKSEGLSDSAVARDVYGYDAPSYLKKVRKIVDVFESTSV